MTITFKGSEHQVTGFKTCRLCQRTVYQCTARLGTAYRDEDGIPHEKTCAGNVKNLLKAPKVKKPEQPSLNLF